MKIITIILMSAALGAAQNPSAKPAAKSATSVSGQSIPSGAVQVEPNLYRFTDAQGKNWMYRRTPFGISKWQEDSVPTPPTVPETNLPRVTDFGDRLQFERSTPFGSTVWTKKKSDLTEEEKAWSEASKASTAPSAPEPAHNIDSETK